VGQVIFSYGQEINYRIRPDRFPPTAESARRKARKPQNRTPAGPAPEGRCG
jgi:hypothetical protein